ncbi:Autophagy protein 22 [Basidiobolus ranarum]|uniref:Autophagy-related protein n=1 Tax=Basidiobolus ranarum TaxID=34480 RepID=A0ABR2X1R8_9FUNG
MPFYAKDNCTFPFTNLYQAIRHNHGHSYTALNNTDGNSAVRSDNLSDLECRYEAPVVTQKELRGWYGYGFACEPFSVSALGVFIPIILESLAAEAGYELDYYTPCDTSAAQYNCVIKIGSVYVGTNSFSLYVRAISVAFQAFVFIGCGAIADHGRWRKTFLLLFAMMGSISGMLFPIAYKPSLWWLATILSIITCVCFGASFVFYASYIPTLTRYHPNVLEVHSQGDEEEVARVTEKVANSISSKGMAWGYFAGVIVLAISAVIVYVLGQSNYSMQIACAFTCFWWFIFTYAPYKWLKSRPGPPLPEGESYLLYSWKKMFNTVSHISQLTQTFRFLLAWFFISDAISTTTSISILFCKTVLGMGHAELLIAGIIVPLTAGIGNFMWLHIQRKYRLHTKFMITMLVSMYAVLPIYGLLGFVLPFGIRHQAEAWGVCIYIGILLGAVQSFCRVMYSELLPPGKESEFFSLYQITDKGSAWIGPLICGAVADYTQNLRYAFWPIVVMLLIPVMVIRSVNVSEGKAQAQRYQMKN